MKLNSACCMESKFNTQVETSKAENDNNNYNQFRPQKARSTLHTHTHTAHMQVRTRAHSAEIISGRRWRGQSSLARTKSCGRVDRRNPETILPLPYRPVPPQHSLWRNQDSPQHKCHSRQRLKDTCWHLTAEHKQQCAHVRIPGVTEPCIIIILWPLVDTWRYIY